MEVDLDSGRILKDRLRWDLADLCNSPERYAACVSSDPGLDWKDARSIAAKVDPLVRVRPLIGSLPSFPDERPTHHKFTSCMS